MHICFIGEIATPSKPSGGIGSFVANLIPQLLKNGCKVTAISYRRQQQAWEREDADGFTIWWINTHQWGPLRVVKKVMDTNSLLHRIHQQSPITIIESNEGGLFGLKRIKGARMLIRLHGGHRFFAATTSDTPFSKATALVEQQSLRKANAYAGVSQFVLDQTLMHYPFMRSKPCEVIPNPVITERFYASRQEMVVKGRLLFYGSLTEKKGIRQLIQAMPIIQQQFPEACLHIYGRDVAMRPSGHSYKALLLQEIADRKITGVSFHEAVPNTAMPAIIEQAEVVVLPSHMEAMPVAWLEAMAMAKPFVAGQPGPGPEVITPNQNGLLANPYEPESIAAQVLYVLQHPQQAKDMAARARATVLEQYSVENIAKQNLIFYQKISG